MPPLCPSASAAATPEVGGSSRDLPGGASKTFPAPLEEVRVALLQSFHRMELVVESDERTDSGYAVTGQAHDRRVEIALEQVGGQFTYMRVEVKRNFFRRDRATAEALVAETESTLAQVKLASQNGASRRSLPRVSMADILRPVALARPA